MGSADEQQNAKEKVMPRRPRNATRAVARLRLRATACSAATPPIRCHCSSAHADEEVARARSKEGVDAVLAPAIFLGLVQTLQQQQEASVVSREVGAGGSQVHKGIGSSELAVVRGTCLLREREERTATPPQPPSFCKRGSTAPPPRASSAILPRLRRQRDEDLDAASRRNIATEQEFQVRSRTTYGRNGTGAHWPYTLRRRYTTGAAFMSGAARLKREAAVHGREAPTLFDTCTHTHRHRVGHMTLSAAAATRRKPWAAPGTYSLKRRLRHTPCAVHALCSANAPGA